jgi:D-alanyl-D-alanine dipeptidase
VKKYLGIDLGGTNIALGIVDETGHILARDSVPTGADRPAEAIIDAMADAAKKLMQAAALLESEGVGLLIWDAFRPVHAQQRLWEAYPDPAYVSPPGTGTQSHCRGCAVDLTLYDLKTGLPLEMPTGFDDFSHYADRDYSDASPEAAANALLLENVMESCGFKPYRGEWWHFTDTDSYEIEFAFDPATNS